MTKKRSNAKNRRPYQNFWGKPKIGKNCSFGAFVDIGDGVVIGDDCRIECFVSIPPGVTLGKEVFVGPHVCFTNDKRPKAIGKWKPAETLVKKGASIGANATILSGITIGSNSLIGAGSVVTKDVPTGEIWAGVPAKKIR